MLLDGKPGVGIQLETELKYNLFLNTDSE